jgi:hypothetical protein
MVETVVILVAATVGMGEMLAGDRQSVQKVYLAVWALATLVVPETVVRPGLSLHLVVTVTQVPQGLVVTGFWDGSVIQVSRAEQRAAFIA